MHNISIVNIDSIHNLPNVDSVMDKKDLTRETSAPPCTNEEEQKQGNVYLTQQFNESSSISEEDEEYEDITPLHDLNVDHFQRYHDKFNTSRTS